MATRKYEPKLVRLTYRDPNYAGPGIEVSAGEWAEEIGPFTTDRNVLATADAAVETHTAAWLVYFTTGVLVGLWKPPTIIEALGLDYATDRKKGRLWQCEGMALVEAARLTETVVDLARTMTTDYRVEGARVMRLNSAACERARRWCEAYERKQKEAGDYSRPPKMPVSSRGDVTAVQAKTTRDDDDPEFSQDPLTFYRRAMFGGVA